MSDSPTSSLFTPIAINRAPVLALWGAVIAERLGHPADTALTLGRAVAGSAAQIQKKSVGPETWHADTPQPDRVTTGTVLLGKSIQLLAVRSGEWRAAVRPLPARYGKAADGYLPTDPAAVRRYLANAFGDRLDEVRRVMEVLAARYDPQELNRIGVSLYQKFLPQSAVSDVRGRTKASLDLKSILAAM